jgi:cytochrome P450
VGDEPFFFNPLAPEMAIDPYPQYHELRRRDPVHLWPLGFWFLTRHADTVAFFADRTLEHRYVRTQTQRLGERVLAEPYFELFSHMVFVLDNPDHRRIRQLFTAAFTPRRVSEMHKRMEAIADDLVDAREAARAMDLVADFAYQLPVRVIGELLGIPDADHIRIAEWVHALNPVLEFLPMSDDVLAKANEATGVLAEYFTALATKRRGDPHDDLFSAMVHAEEEGERLSEIELVANAILLYLAGHETSAGGTGLAVLALHRNPEQLALLRNDPDLVPGAVLELLRYDTPGQATARVTTVPTVFGGVEIPEGQVVVAWIGAANRDPEVFPDPDRLDLHRPVDRDLMSFGGGAHYCIGHALARHELEVALATLLRRCPDLQLETLDPPFRETSLMRGVLTLPVTW